MFNSPEGQKLINRLKSLPVWVWILIGFGFLLFVLILLVDQMTTSTFPMVTGSENPTATSGSTTELILSVFLKLGIVLVLIYAGFYFIRRWKGIPFNNASHQISILETLRLSPRQTVFLIRTGDRCVMIGATDQSINYLTDVELSSLNNEQPSSSNFSNTLKTSLKKLDGLEDAPSKQKK
jgi:flagellar biosynthetic protein FliO